MSNKSTFHWNFSCYLFFNQIGYRKNENGGTSKFCEKCSDDINCLLCSSNVNHCELCKADDNPN